MRAPTALLGLACVLDLLATASAVPSQCLTVAAAASDTSASGVELLKAGAVVDAVCPGMTYGLTLAFPEARAYEVVSTKGAFAGGASTCPNRISGSAPAATKVPLKLYIGCAATGSVKLSVLSKVPTAPSMVLKTVSKPINALSACPTSPCQAPASASGAPSPAPSPAGANASTINLTGNPAADMLTMWQLFSGAASSTPGAALFNTLLPGMDARTVLTMISGLGSMNTDALQASTTISTIQGLLAMVPPGSDTTGMVPGMQRFLSVMSNYVPSTDPGASATQQMSASAVKVISSMGTMLMGTLTGSQTASVGGMLGAMNAVGDLLLLTKTLPVGSTSLPGAAGTTTTTTTPSTTTTTTTPSSTTTDITTAPVATTTTAPADTGSSTAPSPAGTTAAGSGSANTIAAGEPNGSASASTTPPPSS